VTTPGYTIERFITNQLEENCYLLHTGSDAIVIDPGGEVDQLLKIINGRELRLRLILNTHGHIDHICANEQLRTATGASLAIGVEDAPMLRNAMLCGASYFGWDFEEHEADTLLRDSDTIGYGPMHFVALATPGHSPGSRSFYDAQGAVLFSGDLVFQGSVGRWDIPGANRDDLFNSLRTKLLTLPDNTVVYPGHGEPTTVGLERATNPYLQEIA
jgi:hydroxyacylglutathione hydrolase